jgi:hypothetical protein
LQILEIMSRFDLIGRQDLNLSRVGGIPTRQRNPEAPARDLYRENSLGEIGRDGQI